MKKIILMAMLIHCSAASFSMHVTSGERVIISAVIHDNLYVAGGTVIIDAPLHGDLVVGGGTVTINDTIYNDILLGGGTVTLNGFVAGDLRLTGGEVAIKGQVNGDLVAAGGTIKIENGSTVNGDVLIGGGAVTVNGTLNSDMKCLAGEISVNGTIAGDFDCRGGEMLIDGIVKGKSILAATKLSIGNNAEFHQDVRYWSNNKSVDFKHSIKNGDAWYDPSLEIESDKWQYLGFASILGVLWYLVVVFIFIMLIQWLFSQTMKKAANTAFTTTLRSFGYGFLLLLLSPIAILFLIITIIGIPLAVLTILGYITLVLLATIISSVVIANWFNNRNKSNWTNGTLSFAALGIFIVLKMLSLMPLLGWLMMLVVASLAFGGIIQHIHWKRRKGIA